MINIRAVSYFHPMYVPKHFQWTDEAELRVFIQENPLGLLTSNGDDAPVAAHLPFLYSDDILTTHLYRHNTIVKALQANPKSLVVFSVPGAYISPTWYEKGTSVPTWNYMAVHIYGDALILDNPKDKDQIMRDMIEKLEPTYLPQYEQLDPTYKTNMIAQVCGVKLKVERIEAQKKLSQNRSVQDQQNIIRQLKDQNLPANAPIIQWLEKT